MTAFYCTEGGVQSHMYCIQGDNAEKKYKGRTYFTDWFFSQLEHIKKKNSESKFSPRGAIK